MNATTSPPRALREAGKQISNAIMTQIARDDPFAPAGGPSEAMMTQAAAVRAEIEALRKKVARLKAEFNSGKRY